MYSMNPKILKMRSDQEKDAAKIEMLQKRMKERAEQLTALENTDIIGLVRDIGMSVDELFDMMRTMQTQVVPAPRYEEKNEITEVTDDYE